MRDKKGFDAIKQLRQEDIKQKHGNINLPHEKAYMIDKVIRKKLQEKANDIDYSEFIAPIINEKYEDIGLAPGTSELENASSHANQEKKEDVKVSQTNSNINESKDINQKLSQKVQEMIGSEETKEEGGQLTFEEWVKKKEAEEKLRKHLVEIEKEELKKLEEEKEEQKQNFEKQK